MRTVSKLVMRDANVTMTVDQMNQKANEFAEDVFNFEALLANVSNVLSSVGNYRNNGKL